VICAQAALLVAVQGPQLAEGVTLTLPAPPEAEKEALFPESVNVHGGGGGGPPAGGSAIAKGYTPTLAWLLTRVLVATLICERVNENSLTT
jgi:hypothetical protein